MSASTFRLSTVDTAILNQLPDGVACYEAIRNTTGVITNFQQTYCNSLFEQLAPPAYKQGTKDFLVAGLSEHLSDGPSLVDRYASVMETGQPLEHVIWANHQLAGVSLRVGPFIDGIILTIRPVTGSTPSAQKQWVDDVLNASLSNTLIYETIRSTEGHIQDFRITFANDHARQDILKRFGIDPVGSTLLTTYPNSRQSGQFPHCVQVVDTQQPARLELYYKEVGSWYETLITPLGDGCIVTGLDITARKHNELSQRQQASDQERMVQELRQSNENLRQFAQVASHDLQEPLRKIQAFSDILQNQFEDNLSDGERDMAQRIQKSAKRMQLLIKDLLTYSQLAAQRDPHVPVSMDEVVEDVMSDMEIAISENNARLHVSPLPVILGSSSRLRQLVQNLIANALKFKKENQYPLIEIGSRPALPHELPKMLPESVSFWLITLADNGLGFDEKYKDRIFHPFQRLHNTATYSGTGIGLAICQRVAESHGGAIDVSSTPDKGSVFKVFLPVYPTTP